MALDADSLKALIQQKKQQRTNGIDASNPANAAQVRDANDLALAEAIVQHIQDNLIVSLPSGEVVIAVVGQATGTTNATPIDCSVE